MRDNCYKAFFLCSPRLWGHAILFPTMRTQQLPTNHNQPQPTQSTNLIVPWLLSLHWLHFSLKRNHKQFIKLVPSVRRVDFPQSVWTRFWTQFSLPNSLHFLPDIYGRSPFFQWHVFELHARFEGFFRCHLVFSCNWITKSNDTPFTVAIDDWHLQ